MKTLCGTILAAAALVAIGWFGREAVGFKEKPRSDRAREEIAGIDPFDGCDFARKSARFGKIADRRHGRTYEGEIK